ncbi:uncharacterized protein LOC112170807 [Rosa chinensis]|uniref:uncharacterized protein LOC112170807 n=1 Tax=Rosa chinensis TaxID=74649 RepID=UPI000D097387|nr:uncharacterized protein LOC112170807 [Rosa chinensis]
MGIRIDKQLFTTLDHWLLTITLKYTNAVEKKRALTILSFLCWAIWKAPCSFVYKHKPVSPDITLRSGLNLAFEFLDANALQPAAISSNSSGLYHWKPPPPLYAKINCDVAWTPPSRGGLGVVIRDHNADLICGSSKALVCRSVEIAEAKAILLGVNLAIDHNLKKVMVESVSKGVLLELTSTSTSKNWRIWPIINEIRSKSSYFDELSWDWVPREVNRAAHCAASLANRSVGLLRWADQPPPSLSLVLRNDGLPCPHEEVA